MKVDIIFTDERIKNKLEYATAGAAAIDLCAPLNAAVVVAPGETIKIPLGFRMHIGDSSVAAVLLPRSGLGSRGLVLANTIGLIDSDYQGDVTAVMWNRSDKPITVEPMDRVCQMIFLPVICVALLPVRSFEETTDRGTGGFGSTGK